jgi:hypothetical protein
MLEHLSDHFRNAIISSHTLRVQDLIQSFMAFLEDELPTSAPDHVKREYETIRSISYVQRACAGEWSEPCADINDATHESLSSALEDLFNLMQCIAPEGCLFGSSEGDGACFGFWEFDEEE